MRVSRIRLLLRVSSCRGEAWALSYISCVLAFLLAWLCFGCIPSCLILKLQLRIYKGVLQLGVQSGIFMVACLHKGLGFRIPGLNVMFMAGGQSGFRRKRALENTIHKMATHESPILLFHCLS